MSIQPKNLHRPSSTQRLRAISRPIALIAALLLILTPAAAPAQPTTPSATPIAPRAIPAVRHANNVAVITIKGGIDKWTAISVARRIKSAEENGADAIVIDLDTPGGEVGAVIEICRSIEQSSITNTVAWVHPDAYSGGSIIAIACREIVTTPIAAMGDSLVIQLDPLTGLVPLPEAERQKLTAPLLRQVTDSARRNGYDEKLIQALVTLGVELWLVEEKATGRRFTIDEREYQLLFGEDPPRTDPIISARAGSTASISPPNATPGSAQGFRSASPLIDDKTAKEIAEQLIETSTRPILSGTDAGNYTLIRYAIDGSVLLMSAEQLKLLGFSNEIVRNDADLTAFFGTPTLQRLDMSWSEKTARILSLPPLQGLFVVLMLLGLFIEMAAPGLGLPGGIALVALALLVAPSLIAGAASWWGVAAIAGGLGLILVEIFIIPGIGIAGVGGVVLLFTGLVGIIAGASAGFSAPGQTQELLWPVATVLLAFFTAGVGIYFLTKHYTSLPMLSRMVLTESAGGEIHSGTMIEAMGPDPDLLPTSVGEQGVATTPLRPAGSVEINDNLFDAIAEFGFVDKGAHVRVTSVSSNEITVIPIDPSDPAAPHTGEGDA